MSFELPEWLGIHDLKTIEISQPDMDLFHKEYRLYLDAINKALQETAEKFAEASEDVKRILVFTNETFEKIKQAGFSLDDYEVVILEDHFSELYRALEHERTVKQLQSLKMPDPQAIDWDAGHRKGKGERKRASRQQRMQWRKR